MEFLKNVLGDELYGQVESKVNGFNSDAQNKDKQIKIVNLTDGGYVSLEKYQALETKSNGLETQLGEANNTIKSYKDMDIDGIKKSASDWERKYKDDTAALQGKLDLQEKTFAAERYLDGQKIKSKLSRKQILHDFLEQDLKFKDGVFAGADEYMKKVREQYPEEFETEEFGDQGKKVFVRGTRNTYKPTPKSEDEAYIKKKYGNNKYAK